MLAGVVIASLRVTEATPEPDTGRFLRQMGDGLRHLVHDRILGHVLVGFGLTMLVLGYTEASIYALLDSFGKPATFAGVLVTVMGVGAVAGGLLSPTIVRRIGEIGASTLALLLMAATVAGIALSSSIMLMLVLTVPMGAAIPLFVVAYMTLLQRRTPQRLMGRVSTAAEVVMATPQAISLAVGALLVSLIGWRSIFAIMATVMVASALYIAAMLRHELAAGFVTGRADTAADGLDAAAVGTGGLILAGGPGSPPRDVVHGDGVVRPEGDGGDH